MQTDAPATSPFALACNGQPGKINPLYSELTIVTSAMVEAAIVEATAGVASVIAAGVIAGFTFDLLNICGQPQPAPITIDQATINAAVNFTNPIIAIPAQQKVLQWFVNFMWPVWCLCSDNSKPPPVTPTPLPPASSGPGMPSGPQPTSCAAGRFYSASSSPGLNEFVTFFPLTNGTTNHLPVGATSVQMTGTVTGPSTVTCTVDFQRQQHGFGMVSVMSIPLGALGTAGKTFDYSIPVDASTEATQFVLNPTPSTTTVFIDSGAHAYCGPANGSIPAQACCPPDPLLEQRLDQMQGWLNAIWNELVGSKSLKWTDGTRHTGVSGAGSFPLVGPAVAVRAEVTRLPDNPQILPGDPTFYWNMGFITPLANDTPLRGSRLVFARQSFELPAVTDGLAYTLLDGTIVDLVEQLPLQT